MLKALTDPLLSIIYPRECRVCSGHVTSLDDGAACGNCWTTTKLFTGKEMLCEKCGAFFADEAAAIPVFCHKCEEHFYDKAIAAGIYEKALSASIVELKSTPNLSPHTRAIISDIGHRLPDVDLIIPIPLSKLRQIERGYNQAELIAKCIADLTGTAIDIASLTRRSHTPIHRMGMDQKARELTVEKAFEVVRPKLISGKRILLVDDVLTSGATASACAKALKKKGSAEVYVFTLARAVIR